jgi:hypothetical protein
MSGFISDKSVMVIKVGIMRMNYFTESVVVV